MTCRIAVVQHGDYREATRIIASGEPEPYFGMANSLAVLRSLLDDKPHLVISLDAPKYSERRGQGEWVGLPCPVLPRRIPRTVAMLLWAWQIRRLIRAFRPTHVLLRAGGLLAEQVLKDCRKDGHPTLVLLANLMIGDSPRSRARNDRLIALLNDPIVSRVGNHKLPATQSLIECGLDPSKAVAYDWPGSKRPEDQETKELGPAPFDLLYVGTVARAKGIGDVIDACALLRERGVGFRLTVVGDGAELPEFRERAGSLLGEAARFEGRLPNDEVFRRMRQATLIVVPSRPEFPEGMPLTLTEALASRTPIVASDHPIFVRAFRDGEGMRFFHAADPSSLAEAAQAVLGDPDEYARLSRTTAEAYGRVECKVTMGDLVDEWRRSIVC